MISKFVFIGASVLPILYFLLMFIQSLAVTINFSINAYGGFSPFTGFVLGLIVNGVAVVGYICFFITAAAIFLLALQYSDKTRKNLFISGGLFVLFTIFWIITYSVNWSTRPFTLVNGNPVEIQVGNVVRLTYFRDYHPQIWTDWKAPKGKVFCLLLLGVEDKEEVGQLDPINALKEMGWRLEDPELEEQLRKAND